MNDCSLVTYNNEVANVISKNNYLSFQKACVTHVCVGMIILIY